MFIKSGLNGEKCFVDGLAATVFGDYSDMAREDIMDLTGVFI